MSRAASGPGASQQFLPRDLRGGDHIRVEQCGQTARRDTSHDRTQSEAERTARYIAINQRSEVRIHGEDGRYGARRIDGNHAQLGGGPYAKSPTDKSWTSNMVETRRIELPTFALRTRRSPS